MAEVFERTLTHLRNTRDLRAEILSLAADLSHTGHQARLVVRDPKISAETVRTEWDRLLPVIVPNIRSRLSLAIEHGAEEPFHLLVRYQVPIGRPNYRFEVLRLLLDARLSHSRTPSLGQLITAIGASQTPIREAVAELKQAGVLAPSKGLQLNMDMLSQELLAKVRALPQQLRFRYERGAVPKNSAALVERARELLRHRTSNGWMIFALSGTPVAQTQVPDIDLLGIPRVDLTVHVPRGAPTFDAGWLRQLDDGLEVEPSVLAPAPVVVTLVRADSGVAREGAYPDGGQATAADVFLSLLDMGLREQALQYARAVK